MCWIWFCWVQLKKELYSSTFASNKFLFHSIWWLWDKNTFCCHFSHGYSSHLAIDAISPLSNYFLCFWISSWFSVSLTGSPGLLRQYLPKRVSFKRESICSFIVLMLFVFHHPISQFVFLKSMLFLLISVYKRNWCL